MKKLFLLSIVSLFSIISFAQEYSAVMQDISDVNENFEVTVTITIKVDLLKDIDLNMFARFKESVADKCECQFIESAGADTQFKKQSITFIWLENKLPHEDFKIQYKLTFNKIPINRCIDGVFSYVTNDNKRIMKVVEGKKCFGINTLDNK